MTCPRCKSERNILDFIKLEEIEEFAHETNPIYKCPRQRGGCSWQFSPADQAVLNSMTRLD